MICDSLTALPKCTSQAALSNMMIQFALGTHLIYNVIKLAFFASRTIRFRFAFYQPPEGYHASDAVLCKQAGPYGWLG